VKSQTGEFYLNIPKTLNLVKIGQKLRTLYTETQVFFLYCRQRKKYFYSWTTMQRQSSVVVPRLQSSWERAKMLSYMRFVYLVYRKKIQPIPIARMALSIWFFLSYCLEGAKIAMCSQLFQYGRFELVFNT
jgi:hypothetical protein